MASRTSLHGAGALGGRNRLAPPVEAPYGTPLNTLTEPFAVPRIFPYWVLAIGAASAATAPDASSARPAAAAPPAARIWRRFRLSVSLRSDMVPSTDDRRVRDRRYAVAAH